MIDVFLSVFIPLLIIVNPSSTLALFSAITSKCSKEERMQTAKRTVFYASLLLIIFAVAGSSILEYLGIDIFSLRIAGGILLSFVGLDMVRRGEQFGESTPEKGQQIDYSLVPLAMPSLSGPGAITVIIISMRTLTVNYSIWVSLIIAILSIVLTLFITYLIFSSSGIIIRLLGNKGMDAFTRVMGLLTVAIAVQFALAGLASWIETLGF
ncbi:MAG: MarC family protein [Candidatus Thermoplasmatota archaeon]|nr:MarC family protein [Candidatus Thermoplasmatota archaeon]